MQLAQVVTNQVAIMLLMIIVGYVCYKCKVLNKEGVKNMSDILLIIVTPCMLINCYQREYEAALVSRFLMAAGLALLLHILMIVLVTLVFRYQKTDELRKIDTFSAIYSNCGFMGLPLLQATLGQEGVFLGAAYLAVFSVIYWTQGVFIFTGDKKSMLSKKAILNPGVLGIIVGLSLFLLKIELPGILKTTVSGIAALNTPMAMFIIGAFLAKTNLWKALRKPSVYLVSGLRLLILPLLAMVIIRILQFDYLTGMAVLLQVSCPCATVGSLFAARYGLDPAHASEVISVSTVLSIVTIPLIALLSGQFLH